MTIAGGKGGKRHVVGIDATDPVDTLAILTQWKSLLGGGWDNLCDAPMGEKRAVKTLAEGAVQMRLDKGKTPIFHATSDPIHDKTLKGQRYTNSAVMPFGSLPLLEPGRHLTEREMSDGRIFLRDFLQAPGADAKEGLNLDGIGAVADVVLLSTHQRDGQMFGDNRNGEEAFFAMRQAAVDNRKFLGPAWLVTSSCNVCSPDLLTGWLRLMQGEEGTLRGVLGYTGQFADAVTSVGFSRTFVKLLSEGKTFIEAWGQSVEGNPVFQDIWAAICRPGAEKDTVKLLESGVPPLKDPWTVNLITPDGSSKLKGSPRKFDVGWIRKERVFWSTRLDKGNILREGERVEILVDGLKRGFDVGDKISLHVMYRRIDFPVLFDLREVFEVRDTVASTPAKVTTSRARLTPARMRPALRNPPSSLDAFHNTWTIDVTEKNRVAKLFLGVKKGGFARFPDARFTLWLRLAVKGVMGSFQALHEEYEDAAIVGEK